MKPRRNSRAAAVLQLGVRRYRRSFALPAALALVALASMPAAAAALSWSGAAEIDGAGARLARNLGTHAVAPAKANVDEKPER